MFAWLKNLFRLSSGKPGGFQTRSDGSGRRLAPLAFAMIVAIAGTLNACATPVSGAANSSERHSSAPSALKTQIRGLGRGFDGTVGIAIQSVGDGWETGWKDTGLYPQQSVSKLWVSITVLDAVDQGRLHLDQPVTLTTNDLTLFHQPIAEDVLKTGSFTTTIDDLMRRAITTSDNSANDRLMRLAGGPDAVRAMIASKHLGAIRFANGERALQSRIAGLEWSQDYAIGSKFFEVRNALPINVRSEAFNRYLEDPYDGATPRAIVGALSLLKRGELLSPGSTAHLLGYMSNTHTGPNRLKGGLAPGWTLAHKTGTGQELSGVQAGYNDVGILTAPDGKSFAIAVMIKRTAVPLAVRMTLMNSVVEAVISNHDLGARQNLQARP